MSNVVPIRKQADALSESEWKIIRRSDGRPYACYCGEVLPAGEEFKTMLERARVALAAMETTVRELS